MMASGLGSISVFFAFLGFGEADFLASVTGGSKFLGFILILAVSILISGFVDNVPYIIVMLPVAGNMAESMGINRELFLFALLIGSCLGGNLTPFGASANIAATGLLRKEGWKVGLRDFARIGIPFTLTAVAAGYVFIWAFWH